jgi:hypothetical protein
VKTCVLLGFAIVGICASACSKDLEFSIRASPQSIRLGDRISFTFVYRNTSNHEIGIIPEYYAYEALDVHLKKLGTGEIGEMIPYLSPHIDPNLAKRNFRLVKPGKTYSRQLVATVSAILPRTTRSASHGSGLYLVFRDSAIKVPGFGEYEATSRYLGVESYKDQLPPSDKNRLWVGEVFALPITIEFRSG